MKPIKKYYASNIKDSIHFETIKFYVSNVELFQNEELVNSLDQKHILVDLENPKSFFIEKPTINAIKFNVGIDSITNTEGAFGGDLDPTKGMYWTWQSGYINFKLEGVTNACPARKNFFQFHLGGYQYPFNTLQQVELKIKDNYNITINVAIDQFLNEINIQEVYQ